MELPKERWGKNLKLIKPEIKSLYYKGDIDLLLDESPKLAIVGSRRMTEYGQRVIEKWMPVLVERGVTIVSGFMYGVDQTAHKACIENGGKTIAVLGWGIDWPVATQDEALYQKILEVGSLMVSEYEEMTAPLLWFFPQRNRIVVGISGAVLVVEGSAKSGSMITARLANRFGKKLLAVPGQVTSRVAEGTNGLIRDGMAKAVTSAEDVLKEMGLLPGQMKLPSAMLRTGSSDPMLSLLADGERSVDELSRLLKMNVAQVLGRLTELTLSGIVIEAGGKYRVV
ncbi:TPA: DNA-protecting protein DprA [Candidatus Collierbacteria bacterium]|uniref:Topoisomerase n=1 Tax=Candidatus Collierbacteria bacterium GW2011_GWB2_44_22 TaxID=1618387 RepID=A0A0G1HWB8_9BACT|nr:MAG: Topoisomerase [Candidatus Collierbacteria bacterium GW2011_GWA2_44_13]KKT51220.1 MAG: Topoisomerase [Candidatus Collierbacteria bacterium GW2011_GWB2_44_22]KKT62180.1 MAG: Topoisomerase [Candidatus Collierbacteria bacterium GW2011_GWD1_44_27]KKT65669.1 MAG: Topoisomerase [Candidatus Collierbacteria bacterium GW2011_GWC2_44_30]KKT68800.1 MAG: Topoisomerase [Microgenomates group bacterium GW2011_GWC1_44_37]KKT88559.1 MAG: Topoisomerase [Candidatus Collierbacteria bacterium GW2011_GWD2_45